MRLFIAINFDPATKERLIGGQQRLRACASGNFTRPENLHLTVAFLGEVGEAAAARRAVSERFVEPVELAFDRVGTFRRDLYWVGVRPSAALDALYRGLTADLSRAGYAGDWPERLVPHITLARAVSLHAQPDLSFEPFAMTARRLSLMESERVSGALTYTEVFGQSV